MDYIDFVGELKQPHYEIAIITKDGHTLIAMMTVNEVRWNQHCGVYESIWMIKPAKMYLLTSHGYKTVESLLSNNPPTKA